MAYVFGCYCQVILVMVAIRLFTLTPTLSPGSSPGQALRERGLLEAGQSLDKIAQLFAVASLSPQEVVPVYNAGCIIGIVVKQDKNVPD